MLAHFEVYTPVAVVRRDVSVSSTPLSRLSPHVGFQPGHGCWQPERERLPGSRRHAHTGAVGARLLQSLRGTGGRKFHRWTPSKWHKCAVSAGHRSLRVAVTVIPARIPRTDGIDVPPWNGG